MVSAGEVISLTLKREFGEEALNSLEASEDDRNKIEAAVDRLFHEGVEVNACVIITEFIDDLKSPIFWLYLNKTKHYRCHLSLIGL